MTTNYSWPSGYSGVYGAQYNVDTDDDGLIEAFDLTWSNFDEAYINSTMEEFIDGTGTDTLTALESSQKGGCTLVATHVHDPSTVSSVSNFQTYAACNIGYTTDPSISDLATDFESYYVMPVLYEANNQSGDMNELISLELQYTPSVAHGSLTYTDAISSITDLINSALAIVPSAANSLNFKKSTVVPLEESNTVAFESDTAKIGSTTISTAITSQATSESDSSY